MNNSMMHSTTPMFNRKANGNPNSLTDDEWEGTSTVQKPQLNVDLLYLNQYLMDGIAAFEKGDLDVADECYQKALDIIENSQLSPDKAIDKIAGIRTNIAIILFYRNEYSRAASMLADTMLLLKSNERNLPEDVYRLQMLHVLANLTIINIVNQKYEQSTECNEQALKLLASSKDPSKKKALLKELLYIYYRFTSFDYLNQQYCEIDEGKYDRNIIGWYYTTMGINKELVSDFDNALKYYSKALEVWSQSPEETYLIIVTLMHLCSISELMSNQPEMDNYSKMLNTYLRHAQVKNIDPDLLFKDCDTRINHAKDIAVKLQNIEGNLTMSLEGTNPPLKRSYNGLNKSGAFNDLNVDDPNSSNTWKIAVALRLKHSMKVTRQLIKNSTITKKDKENNDQLQMALSQMQVSLDNLKNETNEIVISKIKQMPYTKEAVDHLKNYFDNIKRVMLRSLCGPAWSKMLKATIRAKKKNQGIEFKNADPTKFFGRALQTSLTGEYIMKCNVHSNGRSKKFLKLFPEGFLRFADKDTHIKTSGKFRSYNLTDVEGVVYGKISDAMRKDYNKKLEPWLCISLITRHRSLDFYFREEQVSHWYYALAVFVKRNNPRAFVMTYGKFLWRKLQYLLTHFFLQAHQKGKNLRKTSFAKAIIAFNLKHN